jgi:outer membrane PBP1 activator LpoA protein
MALLYGGSAAFASDTRAQALAPATRSAAPEAPTLDAAAAHIALLLPGRSSALAAAADAVKAGFSAAAKLQSGPQLPVRIYELPDHPDSAVLEYRRAVTNGARLIVGPITRDGVTALASSGRITAPALALNVPDGEYPLPPNLYVLSLHMGAEVAQVARLAIDEGRTRAIVLAADTPLLRRIHQAFVEHFTRLGGRIIAEHSYTSDTAALGAMRRAMRSDAADMAFLALDHAQARLVRPYLGSLEIYATSQINPGPGRLLGAFDLAGVRFLDMPWLLQPDHPAVMVYPRANFRDALDLERLYALGIDAYRIGAILMRGERRPTLDGVTGHLGLGKDQRFVRTLTGAQFSGGKLLIFAASP